MRLWHKDLIPVLPDHQLKGQWRECCAIAKRIHEFGSPNHLLVNRMMDYPISHFYTYCVMVANEMTKRGFAPRIETNAALTKMLQETVHENISEGDILYINLIPSADMFKGWHNDQYLIQCFHNLEEKHDCGGISDEEWKKIFNFIYNRPL